MHMRVRAAEITGGTVLIVKYFDAYFQKDNSPWGLTPETVKLSLNICHADISQLCSPTLADAVNHESFSNIYYAAFYLCSWIGGEGQKPWQKKKKLGRKNPQRGLILQEITGQQ